MSRNGSGTYTLPAGNPVVTNTTISSTWANSTLSDIASALTGSVASDGQTSMTGSLNMASNKIISVTDPTNAQDAATKAYVDTADGLALLKANNLSDVANATTSRTNLSAAKSGANSDITSLTGLTTPLTVAQGGIGAATLTANNVLLGNGASTPQTVAPSTSGNVLTSNGTTWTSAAPTNTYVGQKGQAFTANGTFTIPTGVTAIKLTVVGGGGAGGSYAVDGCGNQYFGVGGGGGGAAIKFLTSLTSGNTLAVTIGGAAGTSSVASGTQTITTVSATGGSNGGNTNGVSGGIGSNGDLNIGGGGTAIGTSAGAASIFGGGGAGGGGASGPSGSSGRAYGGGGGGGSSGGAGAAGVVMIEW